MPSLSSSQRVLMAFYHHYASCIGMNSYHYDCKSHTFKTKRFSRCTAVLANALTLCTLPFVVWDSFNFLIDFPVSKLIVIAYQTTTCVRIAVIVCTVLTRARHEREFLEHSETITQIESANFNSQSFDQAVKERFNRLFYIKYALMMYNMVSGFLSFVTTPRQWHWHSCLLIFLYTHVLNVLHVTVFNYFLTLWYLSRCLCYMNTQLDVMLGKLQPHSMLVKPIQQQICTEEIQHMLCMHWQLADMVSKLNRSYHFQMLATRFNFIVFNVIMGYAGAVFSYEHEAPFYLILFGVFSHLINNFDMYLVDLISDSAVKNYANTTRALKNFNTLYVLLDPDLIKILDQFALQISCRPVFIDIYGFFNVDKRLWFSMIASMISYTIVLIQSHIVWYKNGYEYVSSR